MEFTPKYKLGVTFKFTKSVGTALFFMTLPGIAFALASADSTPEQGDLAMGFLDTSRTANLVALAFFAGIFFWLVYKGRKGKRHYIRPIDAVNELDDAVGRAAEMGRPVMYAPGLGSLTDPVTVASLSILSRICWARQ